MDYHQKLEETIVLDTWGVEFREKLLYMKNTDRLANGTFNTYYYSMGLFKTKNIIYKGIIKDGEIIEMTKFDRKGNVILNRKL